MSRVRVLISGLVQGVFFRVFVRDKAVELGLSGWVRNTDDNKVEAEFVGEKERVEEIIELCKQGPEGARVEEVEVKWGEIDNLDRLVSGFEAR